MIVDDPLLPSAPHLVGPGHTDLLRAAVAAAEGELLRAEVVQVQYRPGTDLVVRYDATVRWRGGEPKPETLLAGVDAQGPFPGTLPLEAGDLVAGVWRYPFDPRLPGLAGAVTPREAAPRLRAAIGELRSLKVRAYRPIRRAVVQARGAEGEAYLKVVRPSEAPRIVEVHGRLLAAGLPVPEVLDADLAAGVLVLAALPGTSLRARLLDGTAGWPPPSDFRAITEALAALPAPAGTPPDVAHAASHHAAAISAILPRHRDRLARILDAVQRVPPTELAAARTIHGDLYEAQLMVDDDSLSGLLDLDDVGPGHPLDDPATLLAHLRLLVPPGRAHQSRLRAYRERLRAELVGPHDPTDLDRRTAGTLVGLATGPFRAQSHAWRAEVRRRLVMAERLAGGAATG